MRTLPKQDDWSVVRGAPQMAVNNARTSLLSRRRPLIIAAVATATTLVIATSCVASNAQRSWHADFENGSFDQWTSWSVGTPHKGTQYVVSVEAEHAVYPDSPSQAVDGSYIAHFEVTPDEAATGHIHAKVYQQYAIAEPDIDRVVDEGTRMPKLPYGSANGTYSAWYYLPTNYSAVADWVNIFQFKRSYVDATGEWRQDPQWWLNIIPAESFDELAPGASRPDQPVIIVNHWRASWTDQPAMFVPPLGRWFQVEAILRAGHRIEWYIDGRLFDTSLAASYPVGPTEANTTGWTFGVGHYGGVGRLWIDDVRWDQRI